MSGICGVLTLDDSSPSVESILPLLERRGPEGSRSWADDQAALGHTLLATTPEASVEVLPLTDQPSNCTITADARLDNREELIAALDLRGVDRILGDGELILRAYLHWGEDCPKNLLGDFAFAIWDPGKQHLFCARDHMGMRQFIYHHSPNGMFVFASDARAVAAHPSVPKLLNRGRVADFLIDLEGLDLTSTFYQNVARLPPAHCLTISRSAFQARQYWELRPGPPLRLGSAEDYAAAFLDVFTEAVRCRLRSSDPFGAMLSGGMDSSSVAAVAADLLANASRGPLQTFSVCGPDASQCCETSAIRAAAGLAGIIPTLIDHKALGALQDKLGDRLGQLGEPFDGHMDIIGAVYSAAHDRGLKIVLDGVAGDVALTAGNRIAGLLRDNRPFAAWRDAAGEAAFWKLPRSRRIRPFLAAAWVAYAPRWLRRLKERVGQARVDSRRSKSGIIRPAFEREVNLSDRLKTFRGLYGDFDLPEIEQRVKFILHPHLTVGRERYDRIASAFAIEPRDPFMDIRLIQFCLSVPAEHLQANGWPKILLRRAMKGKLPEEIIWRQGKEHLGGEMSQTLLSGLGNWRSKLRSSRDRLADFTELSTIKSLEAGTGPEDLTGVDLYYLACWLERFDPAA